LRRFSLLALVLTGCAQIIGIEDRDTALDGSVMDANMGQSADGSAADGGDDLSCERYCALAGERCTAEQGVLLFQKTERCMGICQGYPRGDRANPTGNTLACRITQLERLVPGDLEATSYCPGAGPGGSAPVGEGENAACGSNCVGFCRLRQEICATDKEPNDPPEPPESECVRKCQALPDTGTFNAGSDFGGGADNIQCRLAHLSAAAEYKLLGDRTQRNAHCSHSYLQSSVQCDLKGLTPNCDDYCKLVTTACSNPAEKVYDDLEQCKSVCRSLAAGTAMEITDNNVRCRRARAYDALLIAPANFCEDAGPAPAKCGTSITNKCQNYCELARAACQAKFDLKFPGATPTDNLRQCVSECNMIPDSVSSFTYSVGARITGDTFNCRVHAASQAFMDQRRCDSAVGNKEPADDCRLRPSAP